VALVVSGGPDSISIPRVVGLPEQDARDNLAAAGFTRVSSRPVDSIGMDEGSVVSVTPEAGLQAAPDAPIELRISTGTIDMPDVTNRLEDQARAELLDAGFGQGQITAQNVERDDVPQGTVVETDPPAGRPVGAGDAIVLLIAVPTPTETTPSETTPPPTPDPTVVPTG
jgi:serine/threonine-protein kinase